MCLLGMPVLIKLIKFKLLSGWLKCTLCLTWNSPLSRMESFILPSFRALVAKAVNQWQGSHHFPWLKEILSYTDFSSFVMIPNTTQGNFNGDKIHNTRNIQLHDIREVIQIDYNKRGRTVSQIVNIHQAIRKEIVKNKSNAFECFIS